MRILALDASTRGFSIALNANETVFVVNDTHEQTKQSQQILQAIDKLLSEANLSLGDLTAIAFGHGPGSFTGVRLVSSIVQAIAYAQEVALIPISSLQILAQEAWRQSHISQIVVLTNAYMGEIYGGVYHYSPEYNIVLNERADFLTTPAAVKQLALAGEWAIVGDGYATYEAELSDWLEKQNIKVLSTINQPNAQDILPLAMHYYREKRIITPWAVEPVYLRNSNAWQKKTT